MNGEEFYDDQRLLRHLGAIARVTDGPPDLAYELGRAAFAWRNADSELAQLVADSALEATTVRSSATEVRLLSFGAGEATIDIEVTVRRGRPSLLGQLTPPPPESGGTVRVETSTGPALSVPLDPLGRFELGELPDELLRLRVEAPGTRAVTTVWFSL